MLKEGIEKICDECKELDADLPVYELRGNGLRISFKALQRKMDELKATGRIERIGDKRYGQWIVKV